MKKLILVIMMCCPVAVWAQSDDAKLQRAEHVFSLLLRNETDSLYDSMSERVKPLLKREQLKDALLQTETVAGKYVNHGPWQMEDTGGTPSYTSLVTFEHLQLKALIAFDDEGRTLTLLMQPVQQFSLARDDEDYPLPDDAIELTDTIHTDATHALPCVVTLSARTEEPPIIVMVHGSGALDRDETVLNNKTFLDLARQLAAQGISTLRYDKRTFISQQPTTSMDEETIDDALAALHLARKYYNKVYLLGHSLGAMLAPVIANRADVPLAGIIMMAAPARDMSDVINDQLAYLMSENTEEERQAAAEQTRQQVPYYFEPQHQIEIAKQLSIPILIMQGERDYQVTTADFRLWQEAMKGHANATLHSYPDLNHLFIEGTGKSTPQEYITRKNIPHQVIDDINTFIFSRQ